MVGRERGKRWEREGGNELDREQLHGLGGVNSKGRKTMDRSMLHPSISRGTHLRKTESISPS